jgi:hypothetical protein
MGKRKVSILEPAATAVAETAYFIESKGLPATAKKFIDNLFLFFEALSDERIEHRPCSYPNWNKLNYRCVTYRKKYVIAYCCLQDEIVICEFTAAKLLH